MATNRLSFGGQVLPCYIERYPAIKKAARKFRQYSIPGRNGDIFFQDDAYENVIQTYQVWVGDEHYGAQMDWGNLAEYLYLDGYQVLKDTYDPDHFRKAVFNGPIDVENSWNTHGRATLEFNCRPERYLVSGNVPIQYEHQVASIEHMDFDDLSSFVQNALAGLGDPGVWVVHVQSGSGTRRVDLGWISDGEFKKYFRSAASPTTASAGTTTTTRYDYDTISSSAQYLVLPDIYYEGTPVILVDGEPFGASAVLNNPAMPAYPDIILHNIASYSSTKTAFRINNQTVNIEYSADASYYFIDTENASITCSDSLTGERILANNAIMSADLKLLSGQNTIYTSEWYDATLVPNWWEL